MVLEQLIADCIRRDPRAEEALYRKLYPLMLSTCSRYERNRQDAVARMNEGFLKVLNNLGSRRAEVPFEAWVRRIMINTAIDGLRKQQRQREMERMDAPLEEQDGTSVNDYLREMEAEAFAELLGRVPDKSRKVFNLFAIDGYSPAEIADMLGISEGTSKWHVSHARQTLQQAIGQLMGTNVKTVLR